MSRDPVAEEIAADLRWIRRQRGDFDARLARALRLIDNIGGGSLRHAKTELERIRRDHAGDPDSDVTAFFAAAGFRTTGDSLDQRLKVYATRRHVVERTALRRSDRGTQTIAQLLRDRLLYARPWAYLIVTQRATELLTQVSLAVQTGMDVRPARLYVNDTAVEVTPEVVKDSTMALERHWYRPPAARLDTTVDAATPLASLRLAWVPQVAPVWELVTSLADERLYGRFTVEPRHTVRLEIRWWDEQAASTQASPLSSGRA